MSSMRLVASLLFITFATVATALAEPEGRAFDFDGPGVEIAHSPASSQIYIGSAGIARLSDGAYLAKHDEFGPGSTEHTSAVTRVYRSEDRGKTWRHVAKVDGLFWSNILEHRGAVYMIGTHHHHGALVIVRSDDCGRTWTTPRDGKSGLIRDGQWHTAPMPIVEHAGRLWRAVEGAEDGKRWGYRYQPRVISIAVDDDLLNAERWTVSNTIADEKDGWLGGTFRWVLEGNAVVDRDGVVRNILRSDRDDLAAVATVSADGKSLFVDPKFQLTALPGSSKKMLIRWDEPSGLYWALSNPPAAGSSEEVARQSRNALALFSSPDLREWTLRCVLLHHPDREKHAFQYPDWIVEGDDLLVASRTAYDDGLGGARRAHDANFLTFHRFKNFRELTPEDGVKRARHSERSEESGGALDPSLRSG
jgi:hypothetical protein